MSPSGNRDACPVESKPRGGMDGSGLSFSPAERYGGVATLERSFAARWDVPHE